MFRNHDVVIDQDRLWSRLMALGEIGATGTGGVNRQALTDGEHAAWKTMVEWGRQAGLHASTDEAANLFLTLPGTQPELLPVMAGSHLDSQPTGGKFDGAYGVVAALEAAAALVDCGVKPLRDIVIVAWMNEEGSRFAPGMMGSEAFAGVRSIADIRQTIDSAGISVGHEIDRIHRAFSKLGTYPLGFDVATYLELHIEQNTELEEANKIIGVVSGIQGKKTFEVCIHGTKGHAGTVAMSDRRDAVLAFARIAHVLHQELEALDADVKFTIGRVETLPNAPSVIPEEVRFRVDLRHPDNQVLEACGEKVVKLCTELAVPCEAVVTPLMSAPSNRFDPTLQDHIRSAAEHREFSYMDVLSYAGHDARHMAPLCPSAMIFIPCKDGISHDEREWIEPQHASAGAQVLLDVLVVASTSS